MNCDRVEMLTADYVGAELKGPERQDFENHLAACEDCRERVSGLVCAERFVSRQVPAQKLADRAVASLVVTEPPNEHAMQVRSVPWRKGLSIAAVLTIGFVGGFQFRERAQLPIAVHPNSSGSINELDLQQAYAGAAKRFPDKSGLAWGLLSLARR